MSESKYDTTVSESKSESLLKALEIFEAEQENNKKEIIRPNINTAKIIVTKLICFLLFFCLIAFAFILKPISVYLPFALLATALIFLIIRTKSSVVEWILLYQKYAPERIRASCVFEPSCSQYMLLSIEKYGFFKGFFKGINRLLRCHDPNGGIDYP